MKAGRSNKAMRSSGAGPKTKQLAAPGPGKMAVVRPVNASKMKAKSSAR